MRLALSFLLLAAVGVSDSSLAAESFPTKPVKIVIPFAVGGTADPLARSLADVIQKKTGAVFIVESRPGAGANIGAAEVARSEPDGHTILLGANNNFVVNQFMFPKSSINPERDLAFVSILVDQPQVIYVNAGFPAKTLREFVTHVKARPGQINFASPSAGSAPHLTGELLADQFDLQMVHVPYRGGAAAVTALLAGDVHVYLASLSVGKALIDSGKLRALAVTASTRMKSIPDVPTTAEAGAPDLTLNNWWALATPAGVAPDRIAWIHREFTSALQNAAAKAQLEELGFVIYGSTPDEFAERVRKESVIYQRLIAQRKLAVE